MPLLQRTNPQNAKNSRFAVSLAENRRFLAGSGLQFAPIWVINESWKDHSACRSVGQTDFQVTIVACVTGLSDGYVPRQPRGRGR
jgi:hypothetical protein